MHVPLLVNDFLRRAAQLYPRKLAVVDGDRRFDYGEFQARANRLSNALLARGVGSGDRVCMLSPKSHYFLESYYGTSQIGAMLVPLNYRLVAADHEYIIRHAGVTRCSWTTSTLHVVDEIRAELPRSGAGSSRRPTGRARRRAGRAGMRSSATPPPRRHRRWSRTRTIWSRSTTPRARPRARRA